MYDHNEILRRHYAGMSAREIAEAVGCNERTVTRVRALNGLTQPASPTAWRPVSAERLAAARAMFDDGASRREVSRTLGMNMGTIARHFPDDKWTPAQAGQLSSMVRKLNRVGARL